MSKRRRDSNDDDTLPGLSSSHKRLKQPESSRPSMDAVNTVLGTSLPNLSSIPFGSGNHPAPQRTFGIKRPCPPATTSPALQGNQTNTNQAAIFPGARDFLIRDSTFVMQHFDGGRTVLFILNEKRVRGAEFDSADRSPPPRCHPETRKEMRQMLNSWLQNINRPWNFIWVFGPAGVGKSALAQSFADHCQSLDRLGASYFFSRLAGRDSPNGIIATITYQLATRDAGYNHLITNVLLHDPSILDKTLSTQFKKLIAEPFTALSSSRNMHEPTQEPWVIIIDGLDECRSEREQCELIQLIAEYAQRCSRNGTCPLLWLVCSRKEWHIQHVFARADPPIICSRQEMTCNAAEDIKDVYKILSDGLQKIHNSRSWCADGITWARWPTEAKLQRLSWRAGGLPVLASTIIRFVEDSWGDLDLHLDICMNALEGTDLTGKTNPLDGLDTMYRYILSRVPGSILPITKLVLGFSEILPSLQSHFFGSHLKKTAFATSQFLRLHEKTFYDSLRCLHSVVKVPDPKSALEQPLGFFHKSFTDFLRDSGRSGSFALDMDQIQFDVTVLVLRWYFHFCRANCRLNRCDNNHDIINLTSLHWQNVAFHELQGNLAHIQVFVKRNCWDIIRSIGKERRHDIIKRFQAVDLCHFPWEFSSRAEDSSFSEFLHWLVENMPDNTEQPSFVRFSPMTETDRRLTKWCEGRLPLRDQLPDDLITVERTYEFVSLHQPGMEMNPSALKERVLMAFWMGYEPESTILALLMKNPEVDVED